MTEFEYDAFISYRHIDPDRKYAKWLHRTLETYKVPKQLVSNGVPKKIKKVFRDEEELHASSNLSAEIDQALQSSRFLIVICSPRIIDSVWCDQEVKRFRELGRDDQILALLIEGEPSESFLPSLCEIRKSVVKKDGTKIEEIEEVEPLAADIRENPGESQREIKYLAKLRLLACILGCKFDDLRRREQQRRKRRLIYASIFLITIMLVMAGLTTWALNAEAVATEQRELAEKEKKKAQEAEEKAVKSEQEALKQKDIAIKEKDVAVRTAYRANILLAQQSYQKFNFRLGNKHLLECPPKLRGWEWKYLWKNNNHYFKSWKSPQKVENLRFNKSENKFVSYNKNKLSIWSLTNQETKEITLPEEIINFELLPDGKQLFCLTENFLYRINSKNLTIQKSHSNPDKRIGRFDFTPDGNTFFTQKKYVIYGFDTKSLELKYSLKGHVDSKQGYSGIRDLAINHSGTLLASCCWDRTVRLWDLRTQKEISTFNLKNMPKNVLFSPNGKKVLCSFWNNEKIKVWDVESHEELQEITGGDGIIKSLQFHNDYLISTSSNGSIRFWDENLKQVSILKGETSSINFALFYNNSQFLTLSENNTYKTWETKEEKVYSNEKIIKDIKVSPKYDEFITVADDGKVKVIQLESFKESLDFNLKEETGNIYADLDVSHDGNFILAREGNTVKVWNRLNSELLTTLDAEDAAISPDAKTIATVKDNCITFREINSLKILHKLYTDEKGISDVTFDHINKTVLCRAYVPYEGKDQIYIWDFSNFKLLKKIKGELKSISPSGTLLVKENNTIKFIDGKSYKTLKSLDDHELTSQYNISYFPDNKRILSTNDKALSIWDASSFKLLLKLTLEERISDVEISPNNEKVLAQYTKVVKLYDADLSNAKWISEARIDGNPSLVLLDLLKGKKSDYDEICSILLLNPDLTETIEDKTAFDYAGDQADLKIFKKILNETLIQAAATDIDLVKSLIKRGAEINYQNHENNSALRQAIVSEKVQIAKYLIQNGAEVNNKDHINRTPLIHAAIHQLYNLIPLLVNKGANINHQGQYGWNVLMIAAQYTDTSSTIEFLVEKGADINLRGRYGRTALIIALMEAKKENIPYLNLLVNKNILEIKDDFGWTALMYAISNKNHENIRALLKKGADVNSKDNEGFTPLILAADHNDLEAVQQLLKYKPDIKSETEKKWTAFTFSLQNKNLEMMKILHENGADINRKEGMGWTPLMILCQYKETYDHIKYLLENGADANITNKEGSVALQIALYQSPDKYNVELIKLLGVNTHLNYQNSFGWTPLMYSVFNEKYDAMKFLVEHGADLNLQEKTVGNWSALMMASERSGNHEYVKYLLSQEADPDLQLKDGRTALMIAVQHPKNIDTPNLESVRVLAEKADLNIQDKEGKTALIWAVIKKDEDAVRILLKAGADKTVKDKFDKTAYDYARANRLSKIMQLLK